MTDTPLPSTNVAVETREPALTASRDRHSFGVDALDLAVLLLALLLIIAFVPPLFFSEWTPRFALAVGFLPVGLLLLARGASERDRATIWLMAAIGWTVVAASASGEPRSALVGSAGRDLSALVIVASASVWAAARAVSVEARRLLAEVVVWSTTLAAAVGLAQVLADVRSGPLALASNRPTAFMTNPVYFGALCSGALVVVLAQQIDQHSIVRLLPVFLLGIGVSLSGSRVALAAALFGVAVLGVMKRSRRVVVPAGEVVVALAAGVVIDRLVGAGRNAADRLTEGSTGGRLDVWRFGLEAFFDRPVRGYGFGRFRPAVQGRFTDEFVRANPVGDTVQPWFDAHNIVIGLLVAVGVVGTVLFAVWAFLCVRQASGALAWALIPIAAHWLLQPVSLFTLPLAMLILGASIPPVRSRDEQYATAPSEWDGNLGRAGVADGNRGSSVGWVDMGQRRRWGLGIKIALVAGLVIASSVIVADRALRVAADSADGDRSATIARLTAYDPVISNIVSQVYAFDPSVDDPQDRIVEWRRRSANSEPDRPFWWSQLALAQSENGDFAGARASLDRADDLQDNSVTTLQARAIVAIRSADRPLLEATLEKMCDLELPECELSVDDLLDPDDSRDT